jgi:hypothetical protein
MDSSQLNPNLVQTLVQTQTVQTQTSFLMSSKGLAIHTVLESKGADRAVRAHLLALFGSRKRDLLKQTGFSTIADDARLHQFLAALCVEYRMLPGSAVTKYAE